ncbi:MAG: hypothetical protein ACREQC_14375, partial [Candidatus Binataceae bacterium]
VNDFEALDAGRVHPQPIASVWTPVIAELKQSNALVQSTLAADQTVRAVATSRAAYTDALMTREGAMVAGQLADAASVLGSIWLFEWSQAGKPAGCS